ncbi:MAG: radical SAM protein [Armatimonadota bacterium]|nr:radical SAM protein [Armatimonadota bacterium]MDR7402239.1 radical SAM protein [Armatimonadota bacterium]MDR7403367.1 radical SAM protein [Armatimonadota bacterium]MDR7436995.1 radical SAM protein [Armatimonadota bacterium]MDR7472231.1 radical SAM protein [Armatimonadota bacterium]
MGGPAYVVTVKDSSLVITACDGGEAIHTYDRSGRLFAAWIHQRLYRRALDNRVVEKHTVILDGLRTPMRRELPPDERDRFLDRAAETAAAAQTALARGEAELLWTARGRPSVADALRLVAAAAAFDASAARRDAARFQAVYRPVGILPPDQYLAVVVQVTEGCHWNRCTFCTFYRSVPFHIKTPDELRAHLEGVRQFFGEGLSLRRAIFLGEANALVLPTSDLAERLDLIRSRLSDDGTRPVVSFLDIFTGRKKSAEDYGALRQLGLRRVYLGVETGDDDLLRLLNKPQQARDALDLVRTLKAAGLQVGVIVMAGVGGRRFADSHVDRTLQLLNALPLDEGDLIYLSAFVERPHSDYAAVARARGLEPLTPQQMREQIRRLREGLRFPRLRGPKVARYDIDEFIY